MVARVSVDWAGRAAWLLLPRFAISATTMRNSSVTVAPAVREERTVMDANHFACESIQPQLKAGFLDRAESERAIVSS